MKKFVVVAALAAGLSGCAGWQKQVIPVLSDAAAYIDDAQEIVHIIRAAVDVWFYTHNDEKARVKVSHLLGDVAMGLDAAIRATRGAELMTNEQMDAAWSEFRRAYAELEAVLQDLGIIGKDGRLGVSRDAKPIPEPLALKGRR